MSRVRNIPQDVRRYRAALHWPSVVQARAHQPPTIQDRATVHRRLGMSRTPATTTSSVIGPAGCFPGVSLPMRKNTPVGVPFPGPRPFFPPLRDEPTTTGRTADILAAGTKTRQWPRQADFLELRRHCARPMPLCPQPALSTKTNMKETHKAQLADTFFGNNPCATSRHFLTATPYDSHPYARRAPGVGIPCESGCPEHLLLEHGFSVYFLADLVRSGLASVTAEYVGSGQRVRCFGCVSPIADGRPYAMLRRGLTAEHERAAGHPDGQRGVGCLVAAGSPLNERP
jgi:hypothetical protein